MTITQTLHLEVQILVLGAELEAIEGRLDDMAVADKYLAERRRVLRRQIQTLLDVISKRQRMPVVINRIRNMMPWNHKPAAQLMEDPAK